LSIKIGGGENRMSVRLYFIKYKQNIHMITSGLLSTFLSLVVIFFSCADNPQAPEEVNWNCVIQDSDPDCSHKIGCNADFMALASEPLDASIPGAISAKTVIDLSEEGAPLYFQNSKTYKVHYDFVSNNLSAGNGKPPVPSLPEFNATEYYSPNRRFILGAITYYEGPKVWTYEIAPYDKATVEMITTACQKISSSAYFGDSLYFHPTSQTIEDNILKDLPSSVKVITSKELYQDIDYQPLNYGTSMGRLIFVTAEELDSAFVSFRDIVVLDKVPNDISVTSGLITQMFQTPLAHINVLSQNRGTPNMALRGVFTNETFRALEGKWVKLEVTAFNYSITEVTKEDADAWWKDNSPAGVGIPNLDLETQELRDIEDLLDLENMTLGEALDVSIPAYGGKASHYGAFPHMDNNKVRYPKGFAVPVFYYYQFMDQNGFNERLTQMLEDTDFQSDPAVRNELLAQLRTDMQTAPVDSEFKDKLMTKLSSEYSGIRMRFRSSTNAEDLDGFTGAGLYTSKSGDPNDEQSVLDAIREVWSSVWYFRAFEERSYRNIDHMKVGMALLVHRSFPDEEANGVAITANIYDPSGVEPAFYVNVQKDGVSVVLPDPSITSEQFLYYFEMEGQPIVYMGYSSLVPEGQKILTKRQVYDLGMALAEIHTFFQHLYGADKNKWYAMDTEFKFDQPVDDPASEPVLFMKQARPYPGLSSNQ